MTSGFKLQRLRDRVAAMEALAAAGSTRRRFFARAIGAA